MPEVTRVSESDRLSVQPQRRVADSILNKDVMRVFPDVIRRSVPGYPTVIENIGVLGAQFAQPNNVLYDLGCLLGAITQSLRRYVHNDGCRMIGVDNSCTMIERCNEYLHAQDAMHQRLLSIGPIEADILALDLRPTSLVAVNFTLQFVAPDQRLGLLCRIHRVLLPGDALILSGKLCFADVQEHVLLIGLRIAFKHANDYSELEIARKRSALENVMFPNTFEEHRERLLAADFSRVSQWFRCLNFVSMIAPP